MRRCCDRRAFHPRARWNDPGHLRRRVAEFSRQIAAIIFEPVLCNTGCMEPVPGMIETIRELCDREGMLMIADETITGFRFGSGGAQKHLGFTPDLTVLGKAIGGGVPFAALAGKKTAMSKIIEGAVVGGGAPGDSTGLLRALVGHAIPNAAICINDPDAVHRLASVAIGDQIALALGGRGSRLDAGPLMLEVKLLRRDDGKFELEDKQSHLASMCGDRFDMGPCAVVRHGGLTILLTSRKTPPFDLGQWRSQGIEPTAFSVIAVKAAVAHRRAYDPIAARMLRVDTPGPCTSNLRSLPFRKIQRPVFPLDV